MMLETATQAHFRSAGSVLSIYHRTHPTLSHLRIPLWYRCIPFVRSVESDLFSWKSRPQSPDLVVDDCLGPAWDCGVSSPFSSETCPSSFELQMREQPKFVIDSHTHKAWTAMPILHNPSPNTRPASAVGEDGVFVRHFPVIPLPGPHQMPPEKNPPPKDIFDDDDEGWEDMPVVKEDTEASGLDEEDYKKYRYRTPVKAADAGNARGDLIDFDDHGSGWRSKRDQNESEYTRLRVKEEDDADEVHLRTRYLFDEDKAMTPLSQMQATKDLLTETQRIAYVGLCALTTKEMLDSLAKIGGKEVKPAAEQLNLWALKILGRLYYHMELETAGIYRFVSCTGYLTCRRLLNPSLLEQKMIESLALHGIQAEDLTPPLMTTHTVANPEYDPEEAKRLDEEKAREPDHPDGDDDDDEGATLADPVGPPVGDEKHDNGDNLTPTHTKNPSLPDNKVDDNSTHKPPVQTTTRVLEEPTTGPMAGVSVSLSSTDKDVTLDIRWTVLCDLFLILIADSVYDARSRVLLEKVAHKLGFGWLDVVKFEQRVTEALEIQEEVESLENNEIIDGRRKSSRKKRIVMLGLATLGGGLVIGLSAGLMAPLIGAGLGAALGTVGIGGATGFLAGTAGAAVITTAGTLTGSGIAVRGMARRTRQVQTFELLPLHNNKRVNCILTVPGFVLLSLSEPDSSHR